MVREDLIFRLVLLNGQLLLEHGEGDRLIPPHLSLRHKKFKKQLCVHLSAVSEIKITACKASFQYTNNTDMVCWMK